MRWTWLVGMLWLANGVYTLYQMRFAEGTSMSLSEFTLRNLSGQGATDPIYMWLFTTPFLCLTLYSLASQVRHRRLAASSANSGTKSGK